MSELIKYTTQAIDPNVLSVLDVTTDGKVVTADTWTKLWSLVFERLNAMDSFCVTVGNLVTGWNETSRTLDGMMNQINDQFAALTTGFVHYGSEAPTNAQVRLWVQPLDDLSDDTVVSHKELHQAIANKAAVFTGIALTGKVCTVDHINTPELATAQIGDVYVTVSDEVSIYNCVNVTTESNTGTPFSIWHRIYPAPAPVAVINITLRVAAWEGAVSPYYQTVHIPGITERTKIDLNPTIEQLDVFYNKNIAFMVENNNGVCTVYCIGDKPQNDYTIQASLMEVEFYG